MFAAIFYVLTTGVQWKALPRCLGAGSTVHDRFQEWVAYGCFAPAWARFLEAYDDEIGIDWEWQAADGCIVKAPLGKKGGPARRKRPGATPPTGANVAVNAMC